MNQFSLFISAALIWIWFFWFYKQYRLDRFRQNLFAIRDELFDLALEGRISFDHPAYGMLRTTINGLIRHGHLLNIVDLLVFALTVRDGGPERYDYSRRLANSLDSLDPEVRDRLAIIRDRVHINMVEQVVLTSAVLMFSVVAAVAWIGLCLARKAVFKSVQRFVNGRWINGILTRIDSAAFARTTVLE